VLGSVLPEGRIAVQMRYCEDDDVLIVDSVENSIWKSPGNGSPSIPICHLVLQRILYDPNKHGVNLTNKLPTEAGHLPLVPSRGLPQVHLWPVVLLEGDTSQLT
jgi:hypothetical protein